MKKILYLSILGCLFLTMPLNAQQSDYQSQRIPSIVPAQQTGVYQDDYELSDISDLKNQLSSAVEEIERLQAENYKLRKKQRAQTGAAANLGASSSVVSKLQSQLAQKNHEAQMLRQQLQVANSNLSQRRQQQMLPSRSSSTCTTCNKKKNFFKRIFKKR